MYAPLSPHEHTKYVKLTCPDSLATFPANLRNDLDITAYTSNDGVASYTGTSIVSPAGVNVNVIDLAPLASSQFHRTLSMDIVTVTHGTVELSLDSGDVVELKAGDHVVQRSTMHKWTNPSATEPARFVAVIVPAVGFEIGDGKGGVKEVVEEHVEGSEVAGWDGTKL
jgi:hypothetical protein